MQRTISIKTLFITATLIATASQVHADQKAVDEAKKVIQNRKSEQTIAQWKGDNKPETVSKDYTVRERIDQLNKRASNPQVKPRAKRSLARKSGVSRNQKT